MPNRRYKKAVIAAIYTCISILIASIVYAGRAAGSMPGGEMLPVMLVPLVTYYIMED